MVNFPHYYSLPYRIPPNLGNPKLVPGYFSIYELYNGITTLIVAKISNQGDRLNNILKRGIPLEDAKRIFYEMDG